MNDKTRHLVSGCTVPDLAVLDDFWQAARLANPGRPLPDDYQVRWIGGDEQSTSAILGHIRSGNKTGTVSVPWVIERSGQHKPAVGDAIILINFDGTPAIMVQIIAIDDVPYGMIDEEHTSLDGPRVRAVDVWKPMHVRYFDMLLAPYDLVTDDDTPISFEKFEVVYAP
jgi:uncharacterized protein YhfF